MRRGFRAAIVAATWMVVSWRGAPAWAPQVGAPQQGAVPPGFHSINEPPPPSPAAEHRLGQLRENDRHKRLTADAQRLLQMATELKDQVDHTPKDQLSLEVIRRATEIERLAKDIRERMKD